MSNEQESPSPHILTGRPSYALMKLRGLNFRHNLNCTHTIEVHCAPMKLTIIKFDIEDEDPKDNYISGDSRHHCEWDSIRLSWKEKDGQNSTCSPVFCGVVSQLEDYVWGQGTAASRMSDFKVFLH